MAVDRERTKGVCSLPPTGFGGNRVLLDRWMRGRMRKKNHRRIYIYVSIKY